MIKKITIIPLSGL